MTATIKTPHSPDAPPIATSTYILPSDGFVPMQRLVNNPRTGVDGLLGVSRSTLLNYIRNGSWNIAKVQLGPRRIGFRVEDVRKLIKELGGTA
jgi:predicted DNA-binding transcriptional regulator AlpA